MHDFLQFDIKDEIFYLSCTAILKRFEDLWDYQKVKGYEDP